MSTTQREDVAIELDDVEHRGWTEIEIVRAIDACSAVSFSTPFDSGDSRARERFRPFTFRGASVTVNGVPLFDGTMVDVVPNVSPTESKLGVSCYSRPHVLSEVQVPASAFPLEFDGLTLSQIAEKICEPFGITVAHPMVRPETPDEARARASRIRAARRRLRDARELVASVASLPADADPRRRAEQVLQTQQQALRGLSRPSAAAQISRIDGAAFSRVALEPDGSPWTFLADLAKQRGVIVSDTSLGELAILKSTDGGSPVARLREGEHPLISVGARFAPQGYYSEITGLGGARPGRPGSAYTAQNPRISGVVRPNVFKPDDAEAGDVPGAVDARMGRMFGNLVSYELEVPTWRDPTGALWSPNTTVTLYAPSAMIYRETELLVREVTLKATAGSYSASLTVVLPGAFSGRVPEVLPWES